MKLLPANDGVAPDVLEAQACIADLLPTWYPELSRESPITAFVHAKEYRWSRHLIFQVIDHLGVVRKSIIVKIPRLHDSSGRVQRDTQLTADPLEQEYRALSLLYKHLADGSAEGITAIRPLSYHVDTNALIAEYAVGRNLLSLTLRSGRAWARPSDLQAAVTAACAGGKLLGAIHQIRRDPYPREESFNAAGYCARLEEKVDSILEMASGKNTRNRLLLVRDAAQRLAVQWQQPGVVAYLHGDFYPENIVQLRDGRVYTIDTMLHRTGQIEDDIAMFLVAVRTAKLRILGGPLVIRSKCIDAISQGFLSGYRAQGSYSDSILTFSTLLAAIQRWIEVLSVLALKVPSGVNTLMQRIRVDPFMLSYIDWIFSALQEETAKL